MFKDVHEYLSQLKRELKGSDPALTQDALADAEEHLRTALDNAKKEAPHISETEALDAILEKYGEPNEVASAYKEIEDQISSFLYPPQPSKTRSRLAKFFSIYGDSQAWAAVLYMLFSLVTGILFGLWALFGMPLSLISLIFIIGLPLIGLFLLSLRGIALIEGRIVEALLGIRMPRKPVFVSQGLGPWEKFKSLIKDPDTWKSLAYLILLFPFGWIYFGLSGFALACALSFIFAPVLELIFHLPLELYGTSAFTPIGMLHFVSIGGILLLFLILHMAKFVGRIHGRYAKFMLVRK